MCVQCKSNEILLNFGQESLHQPCAAAAALHILPLHPTSMMRNLALITFYIHLPYTGQDRRTDGGPDYMLQPVVGTGDAGAQIAAACTSAPSRVTGERQTTRDKRDAAAAARQQRRVHNETHKRSKNIQKKKM